MSEYFRDEYEFMDSNGYTIDDAWYPRVTRIVSIKSKPGLHNFYKEMGSEEAAKAVSNRSAEEGTLVHETVEELLLGLTPGIPSSIAPAVAAFQKFAEKNPIKVAPDYVERRILHPEHRYAGTVDALAVIDGKFGILDIKTSQSIYRDYNLQTAAYIEALKKTFPTLHTRWILRIDQTSKCLVCGATKRTKGGREKIRNNGSRMVCAPDAHEWGSVEGVIELQEFPFWKSDFEAFLGAKRLWEWENEWWLKKVGYLG